MFSRKTVATPDAALLNKLFELIAFIDEVGWMIEDRESDASKKMEEKHIENCHWMMDHKLGQAYFDYFRDLLKTRRTNNDTRADTGEG